MAMPEWGYSYNALYVPLTSDWQCSLVPTRDVRDVDRDWRLSYEERQKVRKAREEQIDQDRRDFDRLFRVSISRRAARGCDDFRAYAAFISDHLRMSGLATPVDGESVTRILRDAVRDGWLVPAIDRAWRGSRRVARSYAPQSWQTTAKGGGSGGVIGTSSGRSFHQLAMDWMGLDAEGAWDYIDKYNAMVGRIDAIQAANAAKRAAAAAAAAANNGDDLFGVVGAVAGAVLVSGDDSDDSDDAGGSNDDLLTGDAGDAATPLGSAQPFEYQPDTVSGDVEQDAGVFLTPAEEAECEVQLNVDMDECSAWYAARPSSWGMCRERAMQRYANCLRGNAID